MHIDKAWLRGLFLGQFGRMAPQVLVAPVPVGPVGGPVPNGLRLDIPLGNLPKYEVPTRRI